MKNSKDYSGKIKKLFRAWKRQAGDLTAASHEEPLEALIVALISERYPDSEARKIVKRMQSHFTDLNDLRVSRTEEIVEVMDDHSESAQATAQMITRILNQVYDRYDVMSLVSLKNTGKRQGRKEMEELEGVTRFAADYCFVTALGGHAIPLTDLMKSWLIQETLIHPEATEEEIHGFLERQIPAADAWAFYSLLRAVAEGTLTVSESAGDSSDAQAAARTKKKPAVKKTTKKAKSAGRSVAKK